MRLVGRQRDREVAMAASCPCSARSGTPAGLAAALQPADHGAAQRGHEAVPAGRIVDDVGAIEGRAEHRRLRHLAAIAAADAALVDRRDRIVPQRIVGLLHRERRAAGEADAGVVAGADVLVDAEALAHHARSALAPPWSKSGFTRRCLFSMHSEEATMTFGPCVLGRQRLPQRVAHLADVIGAVDLAHPCRADALHRLDDRVVGLAPRVVARATTGCPARRSPPNSNCRRRG